MDKKLTEEELKHMREMLFESDRIEEAVKNAKPLMDAMRINGDEVFHIISKVAFKEIDKIVNRLVRLGAVLIQEENGFSPEEWAVIMMNDSFFKSLLNSADKMGKPELFFLALSHAIEDREDCSLVKVQKPRSKKDIH